MARFLVQSRLFLGNQHAMWSKQQTEKSAPDSFGEICRIYPHTAGTRLSEMREKDAF